MVWNWARKFAIADLYQPVYANHIHREERVRSVVARLLDRVDVGFGGWDHFIWTWDSQFYWWSSASRPITLHHSDTSSHSHRWMTPVFFFLFFPFFSFFPFFFRDILKNREMKCIFLPRFHNKFYVASYYLLLLINKKIFFSNEFKLKICNNLLF